MLQKSEILEILSKSDNPKIRAAVAANPKCNDELLKELATDDEPIVRFFALTRLNAPDSKLNNLLGYLQNFNTIANDPNEFITNLIMYRKIKNENIIEAILRIDFGVNFIDLDYIAFLNFIDLNENIPSHTLEWIIDKIKSKHYNSLDNLEREEKEIVKSV